MGNLGMMEILLIALVLLIFFGARRIPDLAQGLGKGIREFKRAVKENDADPGTESKNVEGRKG